MADEASDWRMNAKFLRDSIGRSKERSWADNQLLKSVTVLVSHLNALEAANIELAKRLRSLISAVRQHNNGDLVPQYQVLLNLSEKTLEDHDA